jgi:hypothetical protein
MRDKRFVAEHRGGQLTRERHRQLMLWAIQCAQHVLPIYGEKIDPRLENALKVAEAWRMGKASVGDARNAAVAAHDVAREASNPAAVAVARAVGHAVATAHMADHSLGPVVYGLKAVKAAGGSVEAERKWQIEHLPANVKELVLSALEAPRFKRLKTQVGII